LVKADAILSITAENAESLDSNLFVRSFIPNRNGAPFFRPDVCVQSFF
jgi:hypothetical protein